MLVEQLESSRRMLLRALDGKSIESVDFWRGYVEALEQAVILAGN